MNALKRVALLITLGAASAALAATPVAVKKARTGADIVAQAPAADWRDVAAENLLVMELPGGKVMIELAPRFAPRHVHNIRTLVRAGYYDGLAVLRVQDNFVAQWGDPEADDEKKDAQPKSLAPAESKLPAEFSIPYRGLPIAKLKEADGWAPVSGFVDGFAVAADPKRNQAWLTHCYGVVGAGRSDSIDSSNGSELYAIIGNAPRALDLNITVVGKVLQGIELLSALPRGGPRMGFYDQPEQRTPITRTRLAADMPASERPVLQVMRTDSASWRELLDTRRYRSGWYVHSFGRTDVCAAGVPVKVK
jgi:peptidylprolyl isomerase